MITHAKRISITLLTFLTFLSALDRLIDLYIKDTFKRCYKTFGYEE